jgi:hypothetical protein
MATFNRIPSIGCDFIDWAKLGKSVVYQVHRPEGGWVSIPRETYRTLSNPQTRRILLKEEQKIINSTLMDTK